MTCTPPYIEYTDAAGVMGMRMPVNTDGTVCGVGTVGTYMGCGGTIIGDGRYCGYWPPLSMELIAHLVVLWRPHDSRKCFAPNFIPCTAHKAALACARP